MMAISIVRDLILTPRVAIIMHWDSDGIASASILKQQLIENGSETLIVVPEIGYYSVDAIPISKIQSFKPDTIVVLDYALKPWDLEILEQETRVPVVVIDHHVNVLPIKPQYHNPVAKGMPSELYPSTTWVLREVLGIDLDLKILLGVAGDRGVKASETPVWDRIEEYLEEKAWDWNSIVRLAELVDSNYRVGDRNGVLRAVDKLMEYDDRLEEALGDDEWNYKKKLIDRELDRIEKIKPVPGPRDDILVFKVESKYYIASAVTRKLAIKNQDKIVIVAFKHLGSGPCHVYIRSWSHDLSSIIPLLTARGYNAGGKKEVVALTIQCDNLEKALVEVIDVVNEHIK